MIEVLIAEDSPHILDGLLSLIQAQPDLNVVGTACDGLEAVEKASQLSPQVIVMDAQMPRLDGVEATRHIKREFPRIGILFFSVFTEYLEVSVAAGSDGYLTKDCLPTVLFAEIRRIAGTNEVTR
jgi:two-component system NarL family response regulator